MPHATPNTDGCGTPSWGGRHGCSSSRDCCACPVRCKNAAGGVRADGIGIAAIPGPSPRLRLTRAIGCGAGDGARSTTRWKTTDGWSEHCTPTDTGGTFGVLGPIYRLDVARTAFPWASTACDVGIAWVCGFGLACMSGNRGIDEVPGVVTRESGCGGECPADGGNAGTMDVKLLNRSLSLFARGFAVSLPPTNDESPWRIVFELAVRLYSLVSSSTAAGRNLVFAGDET
jgi:hypothetical protein